MNTPMPDLRGMLRNLGPQSSYVVPGRLSGPFVAKQICSTDSVYWTGPNFS
jgi:hypothetical protein